MSFSKAEEMQPRSHKTVVLPEGWYPTASNRWEHEDGSIIFATKNRDRPFLGYNRDGECVSSMAMQLLEACRECVEE